MKWSFLDIDATETEKKYHTGPLSAKLIKASNLDDAHIQELLSQDENLKTSQAVCVQKACARIMEAKKKNEKIFVGGDYDADGVCSTAIMKETLDVLGISNGYYIPDRFKEGYGLSAKTVTMAHEKGYSVIMTVDNGVKAHEALKTAKSLGMDVIVTDHHVIEEEVEADILVHPDYMEDDFQYFSGAGVALEISRNLIGNNDHLTALAAVAAIGDAMPLWKETRKLVRKGISLLKQGKPSCLALLLRPGSSVDETSIAFQIVPKLNAVGRMNTLANVNTLPQYLLLKDSQRNAILHYREQLNQVNETRKQLSGKESEKAAGMITDEDMEILYDPDFHEGICGLVAGKIASRIHKPTLVMAKSGDLIKGSGRSVPGFNLFEFFSSFEEPVAFGGHEMAVGLSLRAEDFEAFRMHAQEEMKKSSFVYEEQSEKAIMIHERDVTFDNIADLQSLCPYPKEMVPALFVMRKPVVLSCKNTPKTIRYQISAGRSSFDATVLKQKHLPEVERPQWICGNLSINRFRGHVSLQMMVEDLA